jgi:hypothetical protein
MIDPNFKKYRPQPDEFKIPAPYKPNNNKPFVLTEHIFKERIESFRKIPSLNDTRKSNDNNQGN